MATGLDRREIAAETTRTASREYNPQAQGLVGVSSPRGDNGAGMRQHEAELSLMFDTAGRMGATYAKNYREKQAMQGKLLYQQGKSEADLEASGANRYTVAGFKLTKMNTEAIKWAQTEDDAIMSKHLEMDSDSYRGYLNGQYSTLLEQAGDDEQSKKMLSAIAEKAMPQLLSRQINAHETWKENQTALTYADNLVTVASSSGTNEDDIKAWISNNISDQMPMPLRNKMLSLALEQSLDNDNTKIKKVFDSQGGFRHYQFDEAQQEGVNNAVKRLEARVEQKQRQHLSDSLAKIDLDLETNNNFSAATQKVNQLRAQYGSKFGTAVFDNAQKGIIQQQKSYMKEQEESNVLLNALGSKELYALPQAQQQKAYKLLDVQIQADVQAKIQQGVIKPEEAQDTISAMRVNAVAQYGVANESLARQLTGRLGIGVLGEDGKVTREAEDAFDEYLQLKAKGGAALAKEHIKDSDTQTMLDIAEDVYHSTGDGRGALARARQLVEDNSKMSLKERRDKFSANITSGMVDEQITKLRDRITPGFMNTWLGNNASGWIKNTVHQDEIDKAVNDPGLSQVIKNRALTKLMTTPGMQTSAAVKAAYEDVISKGDFVMGTFVVPGDGGSIKKDLGFDSKNYNVADIAVKEYLKEFGPALFTPASQRAQGRTNPDYNKWDWSHIYKSLKEVGREVPEMDVGYMSSTKSFIFTAYKDKGKQEPLNAVPVIVPAKDIGDWLKKKMETDTASRQAMMLKSRMAYEKQLNDIKAKYMPETYGEGRDRNNLDY